MGQTNSREEPHIESFLAHITFEERQTLFKLIKDDKREDAIDLLCTLINRPRCGPKHLGRVFNVPFQECRSYGVYVYELLKCAFDAGMAERAPENLWRP